MTKKILILFLLIITPNLLGVAYDKMFRYAGNWLEDYQNYFKLSFLIVSLAGTVWLVAIARKEKSWIWFWCSLVLLILLLVYLFFAVAIMNSSY